MTDMMQILIQFYDALFQSYCCYLYTELGQSAISFYTVFRKKHPLVFSFITSSQVYQFSQKFQHL